MHIRKYIAILKAEFKNRLMYQLDFLGYIIYFPMEMVIIYFLWYIIYGYSGQTVIAGFSFNEIVVYFLLQRIAFRVVEGGNVLHSVGQDISRGELSVYLCRPIDYPTYKFFSAVNFVLFDSAIGFPILIAAGFFLPMQTNPFYWTLFLVSMFLGIIVNHYLTLFMGLLAFWTNETSTMGIILDGLKSTFSGSLVPLTFYPNIIQQIISFLPFKYIYFVPIFIYLGMLSIKESLIEIIFQSAFAMLLIAGSRMILKKGLKRFDAQGG